MKNQSIDHLDDTDTERRYITWSTDKIDNALTKKDAVRKATALVSDGTRRIVFVLEVLYVVKRAVPPITVEPFKGGKV